MSKLMPSKENLSFVSMRVQLNKQCFSLMTRYVLMLFKDVNCLSGSLHDEVYQHLLLDLWIVSWKNSKIFLLICRICVIMFAYQFYKTINRRTFISKIVKQSSIKILHNTILPTNSMTWHSKIMNKQCKNRCKLSSTVCVLG